MQSVASSNRRHSERGAVLVMVAVWLPVLALFVSFAIDFAHFFDYSRNLQNRADAIVLAAGDQLGNACASDPTDPMTSPELGIGQMGQLFSGPLGSSSDLPYPYSGPGSPLAAFPQFGGYQNIPNLTVSNGTNGANYHVLLNADDYAPGGANFAIGDFCHGDPTLDATDKECFGQTNLTGQLALDCATGAMIDAKLTQTNLPLFFPLLGIQPNIHAQSRVAAQGIGSSSNLKPLGVKDAGVVPCVRVTFYPTSGATSPQTVQLKVNKTLTGSTGPIFWDNSGDNAGAGDAITIPSGANVYMKATLYAEGSDGTCATLGSPITYEQSNNGILYLNSYGTTAPAAGQPPRIIGDGSASSGVTVLNNTCTHDQYFSNNLTDCSVNVCAIVAFTPASTNQDVTVSVAGGPNRDMNPSADPNCSTTIAGASAWESDPITIASASGQRQFTLGWKEQASGVCNGNGVCTGSFGVQQQAFSACNEDFNAACGGDPNVSGPIVQAYLAEGAASTIGAFQGGTTHNLVVTLALQGLQDSPRSDRCTNGLSQCTLLRVDQGNADGMVDCGEGNSANNARAVILFGCPLYGQTGTPTNPVVCSNDRYCGGWQVTPPSTPDGVCNNGTRTATSNVDCINTNNNGAMMPACIQALIVAAGGNGGVIDYSKINLNNCHVTGSTCSEDKWLTGAPIVPGETVDPRILTTFIVYQGDISGATGNHDMQIRTFASFYVTGWQFNGAGMVTCTGAGANEPPPTALKNSDNAIWGHWISYTEPGAGGNGQPCDFNAFGDCAVVLTR